MPGAETLATGLAGSSWAGPVAIANAVGSMASGLFSNSTNKKIAKQNIDFQREVNQQNERLMREAWARDDTSRQRMVADLESAGLSKWLATGASPSSSSPISLGAPENNYKPDYSMFADAAQHAYNNFLDNEQTTRQNQILDKQGQVLDEEIAIKEAEKEVKQHDAAVFKNRPDVASTDPAYMKMLTEAVNVLTGKDKGQRVETVKDYLGGKVKEKLHEPDKAVSKLGIKNPWDWKIAKWFRGESGPITEKKQLEPLSFSDWLKTNQLQGSQYTAKSYAQYKENFYKSRR